MKMQLRLVLITALTLFCIPLSAEYNRLGVPDSSEIRSKICEEWFYLPVNRVKNYAPKTFQNNVGQLFQISTEEKDNRFYTVIAPAVALSVDVHTENGITQDVVTTFPFDASGSWILIRNTATGDPLQIRLYFTSNSDVYLQLSPDGKKTLVDFIIDGCYAAKSVPVGTPFERFYTASLEELIKLTERSIPWNYAVVYPALYNDSISMINTIRKNLDRINFETDACYDEKRRPVYISTGLERPVSVEELEQDKLSLSSEGFVKWIVDGLVEPLGGNGIYTGPMLRSTVSLNPLSSSGIRNETKDNIYFTLDWTRNLAAARFSIQTRKNYYYEQTGVDVTVEPFSSEVSDQGIVSTAGYLKNCGYNINKLRPLLYVIGIENPTYCYLAAIREKVPGVEGKDPEYHVFNKSAVIFPYFDKHGRFKCSVFENANEMSLETFVAVHPDCYVYLTRVLTSSRFNPQ